MFFKVFNSIQTNMQLGELGNHYIRQEVVLTYKGINKNKLLLAIICGHFCHFLGLKIILFECAKNFFCCGQVGFRQSPYFRDKKEQTNETFFVTKLFIIYCFM